MFVVWLVCGDQYDADLGLPSVVEVVPNFSTGGGEVAHDDGPDGAVLSCEQKEAICRERYIRWVLKVKLP